MTSIKIRITAKFTWAATQLVRHAVPTWYHSSTGESVRIERPATIRESAEIFYKLIRQLKSPVAIHPAISPRSHIGQTTRIDAIGSEDYHE